MRLILRFRPFSWFFRKDWYSLKRWGMNDSNNESLYLVDIGAITFGVALKKKTY